MNLLEIELTVEGIDDRKVVAIFNSETVCSPFFLSPYCQSLIVGIFVREPISFVASSHEANKFMYLSLPRYSAERLPITWNSGISTQCQLSYLAIEIKKLIMLISLKV